MASFFMKFHENSWISENAYGSNVLNLQFKHDQVYCLRQYFCAQNELNLAHFSTFSTKSAYLIKIEWKLLKIE